MADSIDGLDAAEIVNRSMVVRTITNWFVGTYVTDDTTYDPRERRQSGGFLQERGECVMATDLPATAIAIEFVSDGNSISEVIYAPTYGCGDPL